MNEIVNNKVNLCDSCSQVYPDCTSKPENVYFGDGIGHDNICACSEYQPKSSELKRDLSDTISRQAALDAIRSIKAITGTSDDAILLIDKAEAQTELVMLPSAQPQRMRGKWIDVTKTGGAELWKCSECGELELEDSYFCPNYGADMRQSDSGDAPNRPE